MTKRLLAAAMAFILCISGISSAPPSKAAETKAAQTNMALGKTVYYSSEEGTSTNGADTHADRAVDGNNEEEDFSVPPQTASGRDEAYVKEIDGEWLFGGKNLNSADALKADLTKWNKVTIPHTWNAKDAEDGGGNYDRAAYWYHKEITVPEEMSGKSIYIEFTGSNTQTTLYVNGKKAGDTHKGGYTAFRYDVTDLVKEGVNTLDVCVDNTYTQTIAPISGDFNMYGGIYRRVYQWIRYMWIWSKTVLLVWY